MSRQAGLEGVVAKRLESRYSPGRRSADWVKVKIFRTQEVVVAGWKPGTGRRDGRSRSLLLGVNSAGSGLVFAGKVGTGFTQQMLAEVERTLRPLARETSPFATAVPRDVARDAHWVEPKLVGEVMFSEWTRDGRLRAPSWRGLRDDKDPAEVVRTDELP